MFEMKVSSKIEGKLTQISLVSEAPIAERRKRY